MVTKKNSQQDGFFHNAPEFFKKFTGKLISAEDIKLTDFTALTIAIVGASQQTVMHLDAISLKAKSIKVFQTTPHFVLPHTEKGIHRLVSHPLIIKNRRLFNNRVKSLLAIRYLDSQIHDQWLKRQLMPNSAAEHKVFLKSDSYYSALQREHCHLITWPIMKITETAIQTMDEIEHTVDVIITTY
ncbi:flavoprotein [Acinetobacter sp. ANC 4648]|uniref:flavoprotein n=1 Tax=Acinetobacter sp. ANC 4648 TaxID=1977875 RepID=UPI000A34916C|nr:flavoprotein [Acinetobacter sp. ANC 4648]OTG83053.1 flavoprotein [Acinetobacter sp. ANC 4648]